MNPAKRNILVGIGIFAFAILLRSPSLNAPFFYDDFHAALNNPAVVGKADMKDIFTDPAMFSSIPGRRMYRPLTLLSYAFSYKLSGTNPAGWRAFNLLFHGLLAALVFGIALRLFGERESPAIAAALLWASHPLLDEGVIYIAARSSLLAATAILAGVYFHLSLKDEKRRLWSAVFFLCIGLFCKETAAVLPALLFLGDLGAKNKISGRASAYLASLTILVFYILFRRVLLDVDTFEITNPVRSVRANLLTQSTVIPIYLLKSLFPFGLSIEWGSPEITTWIPPGYPWRYYPVIFVPMILLIVIFALLYVRRYPILTFGVGWFFVALSPESGIIPLTQTANERRLYLPLVGLAIVGGWIFSLIKHRGTKEFRPPSDEGGSSLYGASAKILTAALVICFSTLTVADSTRWKSVDALWAGALKLSPTNIRALHGLASARLDKGDVILAEKLYRKLLTDSPDYAGGYMGLGRIASRRNRAPEAEYFFIQAALLDRNNDAPLINLIELYIRGGDNVRAEMEARLALETFSNSASIWNNLGAALAAQGKLNEAIEAFDMALALYPSYATAANNKQKAAKALRENRSGKPITGGR